MSVDEVEGYGRLNMPWGMYCDGPQRRENAYGARHFPECEPPSQKFLDLDLSPVCGFRDQVIGVLRREVGRQEPDRRQVKPALGQSPEESREAPCRSRRMDALCGRVVRKAQMLHAIGVHRRAARRYVELTRVDLGDMRQQGRRGQAVSGNQSRELAEKNGISEMG